MPTECHLLAFLTRNAGRVLTRTTIFEAVWRATASIGGSRPPARLSPPVP
ncbi:winged helix-turn-helix domain-containing protein [Burkholderia sp. AU16741]